MEISSTGGAGPDGPSAAQLQAMQLMNPPDNEVPVVLPVTAVLGRTAEVAVAVVGLRVFSTGIQLDLMVRVRTEPGGALRYRLHELVGGFVPAEDTAGQRLLLGLEYADGRTATNLTGPAWWPAEGAEPDPEHPTLMPVGGGGGDRSIDQGYWLTPVPPPGPLTFICAWSAFGIAETRTVIDLSGLAAAASAVQELWPWQPPDDQPREPVPPELPAGSWFAEAARTPRHGPGWGPTLRLAGSGTRGGRPPTWAPSFRPESRCSTAQCSSTAQSSTAGLIGSTWRSRSGSSLATAPTLGPIGRSSSPATSSSDGGVEQWLGIDLRVQPGVPFAGRQDQRHPVVDLPHRPDRVAGDDRHRDQRIAVGERQYSQSPANAITDPSAGVM